MISRAGRRSFLLFLASLFGALSAGGVSRGRSNARAQTASGMPLPDETVEATLKRLFGNRKITPGDGKVKLDVPLIAEDGGNVAVTVESSLPVSGSPRITSLYIIADKNRRPMLAKFSFTPESGKAFIATSVRLATSTDVRAMAETDDGSVYAVSKNVRVTISGCDLPPQG